MDSSTKHVKVSPEENANIFSKLVFWWFYPFFWFGYKNDLKFSDIYNSSKPDLSGPLGDLLEKNWNEEIEKAAKLKRQPLLKTAILKTYGRSFIPSGFGIGLQWIVLKLVQPVLLSEYINYFSKNIDESDPKIGWGLATGLVLIAITFILVYHQSNISTQRVGMRIRVAVCSLIYRKLLRLNHTSLGETAAGQLVNFLSNDVQRFDNIVQFMHFLWITPFSAAVAIYILYNYVGVWPTVVATAFIILQSIPLQAFIAKFQGKLRYKISVRTDSRIKLMNEITSGIQVIKVYAWEKPFEKVVERYRKLELNAIIKTSYVFGVVAAMSVFTERLILYLTLITYILVSSGTVTGQIAFSLAQLFNIFQIVMTVLFPRGLISYEETIVSIRRIEKFLLLEENETIKQITNEKIVNTEIGETGELGEINLFDVSARWTLDTPTLTNVNFNLKPGTLCCVVGNVGSGKSSLLQLLLKELAMTNGKMNISGKMSYACQEPWLFSSNVRQNILFGKPYVKKRYSDVVRVCSLERDFKQFPHGDKSSVGERGTSLSGGQKARVNLARAVYQEADIYLFDDPLSAVDTKVGKHLFEECIIKYLKGKTRILVTHQLQFMKKADVIISLNEGKIEKMGTFEELSETNLNVFLKNSDENKEKEVTKEKVMDVLEEKTLPRTNTLQSNTSLAESLKQEENAGETDELIAKGNLPSSIYWEYFSSGNSVLFLFLTLFLFIMAQVISNASDLWLSNWTNMETARGLALSTKKVNTTVHPLLLNSTDLSTSSEITPIDLLNKMTSTTLAPLENSITSGDNFTLDHLKLNPEENMWTRELYIYVYSGLILASVIFLILRSFLYYQVCMGASRALHHKMFHNILQAPMRFFDINPSGRILSRFSKDMGSIDEALPHCLILTVQVFMVTLGNLVIVFMISPWMIIPTLIIVPILYFSRIVYLVSAQAIKRFEGTSKAPVFSHISASLFGISTIRASEAEQLVIDEFDVLQDQHTSTWFLFMICSESYGFILDCICTLYLGIVIYQFMIFRDEKTQSGMVGLAISNCMILCGTLQFGMRQTAEVASHMVSVERVLQYTKLDKEGPFESLPAKKPPKEWPSKGRIIFKNTYLRYALDLTPALKNLNIEVESGEKIGVVGRTGAGKSTMIASLFRLAPIDGQISIDGINTAEIGLNDLRLNISIIPQEPTLFSASVRYNLDPFERYSDETLWNALEHVELKNAITDLNQQVTEGGSNFSAGQRQLICLARAIVRNNKVLVMDEATANVDPQTDSFIQKTIRDKFKECTVLTVAHRLNTIMDSDRVLVMEGGEAVEFDHPYVLLQNSEGYFSKMLKETGPTMEEKLKTIAKEDYVRKKGTDKIVISQED